MNFTPVILAYISTWSKQHDVMVDVRLQFDSGKFKLVYSFININTNVVWNKAYDGEYMSKCPYSLYELTKQTLKEAEGVYNVE